MMLTISFGLPFEPEDSQYGKYRPTIVAYRDSSLLRNGRTTGVSYGPSPKQEP